MSIKNCCLLITTACMAVFYGILTVLMLRLYVSRGVRAFIRSEGCHQTNTVHLLPLLSNSLPVIDKLAKPFIRFLQQCLSSDSYLVRFVTNYGVHVGCIFSPIGLNVFFCCSGYMVKFA